MKFNGDCTCCSSGELTKHLNVDYNVMQRHLFACKPLVIIPAISNAIVTVNNLTEELVIGISDIGMYFPLIW